MSAASMTETPPPTRPTSGITVDLVSKSEERSVIFASSLGTIFEWYDFYLYAVLAPFFSTLFFPTKNETAALLSAFVTYAAGFLVRPFGALVFGRIGDRVGRKYTFLITISVMGASTFAVGLLPTFITIGWAAPTILTVLRLVQGLALGGEYGGAATYVAEHSPNGRRGFNTSWIQTTATLGLFLALVIIGACRANMSKYAFGLWGWRIPFVLSLVLLVFSIYIRLKLQESPAFRRMIEEGRASPSPLRDSFFRFPNNKYVFLALFGATAGQGVVWYTGQFWALFFLGNTLKLDWVIVYKLVGASLVLGTPLFVVFGRLSDRVGRLRIILAGCVLAAATYLPLFKGMTHFVNPALEAFQDKVKISVAADDCHLHVFVGPWTKYTPCESARNALTTLGLSFDTLPAVDGAPVVVKVNDTEFRGWDKAIEGKVVAQLKDLGYPAKADPDAVNYPMTLLLLVIMLVYVTMVYGPIAAYLVELFPVNIRYTSMSLPYHIGNGWFGGMLPLLGTALMASSGDIYRGLWYPIAVALITAVVGAISLRETSRNFDIHT